MARTSGDQRATASATLQSRSPVPACTEFRARRIVCRVDGMLGLIEFPADDPDRARRFWSGLLGAELTERSKAEGQGWQTRSGAPALGVHERGAGPGDTVSLPYFKISDM